MKEPPREIVRRDPSPPKQNSTPEFAKVQLKKVDASPAKRESEIERERDNEKAKDKIKDKPKENKEKKPKDKPKDKDNNKPKDKDKEKDKPKDKEKDKPKDKDKDKDKDNDKDKDKDKDNGKENSSPLKSLFSFTGKKSRYLLEHKMTTLTLQNQTSSSETSTSSTSTSSSSTSSTNQLTKQWFQWFHSRFLLLLCSRCYVVVFLFVLLELSELKTDVFLSEFAKVQLKSVTKPPRPESTPPAPPPGPHPGSFAHLIDVCSLMLFFSDRPRSNRPAPAPNLSNSAPGDILKKRTL